MSRSRIDYDAEAILNEIYEKQGIDPHENRVRTNTHKQMLRGVLSAVEARARTFAHGAIPDHVSDEKASQIEHGKTMQRYMEEIDNIPALEHALDQLEQKAREDGTLPDGFDQQVSQHKEAERQNNRDEIEANKLVKESMNRRIEEHKLAHRNETGREMSTADAKHALRSAGELPSKEDDTAQGRREWFTQNHGITPEQALQEQREQAKEQEHNSAKAMA